LGGQQESLKNALDWFFVDFKLLNASSLMGGALSNHALRAANFQKVPKVD
jgi:hypothetical protein